jgi:pyruvate/2-oxoglutarate dehydrogenase complex dihydrolipoamide dehydrogenase (E3) component
LQKQIDYLKHKVGNIPVIKKEAKAGDLIGKYDGVILATGSKPFIPQIDGLKEYKWAEILRETNVPLNKNVLIIGGGLIGIEIANTLTDHGNKVTIVELLEDIGRDMEMVSRKLNLMKLQKNGVPVYTNTKIVLVEGSAAILQKQNEEQEIRIEDINIYVVAAGMHSEKELLSKLENQIHVYVVGDADNVGDVVSAIQSAYFTCKEL